MMTRAVGKLRRRLGGKRIVEAVIDLVRDEADALAFRRRDQLRQRLGAHHGAGRIGGACDQHALERCAAMRVEQRIDRDRPARAGRDPDHHRFAAQRGEDVAVRRIARARDRDPVARLEHREERQDEAGRRTRRHDDALGLDRHAMRLGVMPRDAVAQRRHAERRGIADVAGIERRPRGRDRGRAARCGRLADLHVDDAPALRLDAGRRRHHVHHHEGRHVAARRGRDQPPRFVQHSCSPEFSFVAKCLVRLCGAAIGGFLLNRARRET